MAHIKNIHFQSVDTNEGCTCDRCGQHIKNIWTVEYKEGLVMHYGIDCWEKVYKAGLNTNGRKILTRTMKSLQAYEERLAGYVNGTMTEETDITYQNEQAGWQSDSYWHGKSFDEYKKWMVTDFLPYRIELAQKELEKLGKVNFNA